VGTMAIKYEYGIGRWLFSIDDDLEMFREDGYDKVDLFNMVWTKN
jgi:hypothetical protein